LVASLAARHTAARELPNSSRSNNEILDHLTGSLWLLTDAILHPVTPEADAVNWLLR